MGFVKEIGMSNNNNVGKKAVMLDICTERIFFTSVMLTEDVISVAQMNLQGKITRTIEEKVLPGSDSAMIETIIRLVNRLWEETEDSRAVYYGLGIAVPAPIKRGMMMESAAFKSLVGFNLLDILKKEFNCPIKINNNADAAALAESWFGNYYNVDSLAFILIDQGIGCGVVINEELFIGKNGLSNEFGHTIVGKQGYTDCFCGNSGCLSSFASDRALAALLHKAPNGNKVISIHDGIMKIEVPKLHEALLNNKNCNKAVDAVAEMLGIGLANLIDTLSADMIIVEGHIAHIRNFLEKIEVSCAKNIHPMYANTYSISHSKLGLSAPLIGAGTFLYKDLCMNPYMLSRTS
jgi:predicted NBD/HSP70 family sugar kinase